LKKATKRTLNINEGSPLHDAVMKAMEEYAQEQVKLFCQPAVIKSVCDQCRFESECRFKAENVEQNCKFFIDKQTVL
jgi:hypothetical protein